MSFVGWLKYILIFKNQTLLNMLCDIRLVNCLKLWANFGCTIETFSIKKPTTWIKSSLFINFEK